MTDNPFGEFKFDDDYEVYENSMTHRGRELKLSIRVDDGYTLDDALPIAIDFWTQREKWFTGAQEKAQSGLLETINDRIENDPKCGVISASDFSKSLSAPDEIRLAIDEDQKWFALSYYSDLYGEHAISVAINLTFDSIDAEVTNLY